MANTINADLNNNIIAQNALEQFTKILSPLNAFSTSFNDEAGARGDSITILNLSNTSSVTSFSGTYSSQDTTYGKSTINLSTHKFCTWHITDLERSESSSVELQRFGYQKGGELATAVIEDIFASLTSANYADSVTASGDFGIDDVASVRKEAIDNNLPIDDCSLILNPTSFSQLIQDSVVGSALNYGGSEAIRGGRVPSLMGIPNILETNATIHANSAKGFLAHPSALAVAMRYLEPLNNKEYISTRKISDPETGIVMGYREFYEPDKGKQTAVLEVVYGFAVGRGEGLVRIV